MSVIVSYLTADLAPHAASLQRDRAGFYVVGRERTRRLDIALLLAQRPSAPAGVRARAGRSQRHAEVLSRAQRAIVRAREAIVRGAPIATTKPLTPAQRAALDRLTGSRLLDTLGSVLGRELAARDARIEALESKIRGTPAGRAETIARARAALQL
ncbi:hypothetical protein QTI33_03700 [Variovorax sp. J22P271]|uniref:hypothetical protein n=1 Tax=Variovorax davisae TaxID=3053515 RepID=UPI0025765B85|nr:hypothetical protein [Variovorax sp. J22P271]MDM0031239.1 hypothetical protein [Variovorax sp. J22P271]